MRVAVDEFQHICYANPNLTPKERTLEWKKLEQKYMPWRTYDADDFFDRGGYWYHKIHIFPLRVRVHKRAAKSTPVENAALFLQFFTT